MSEISPSDSLLCPFEIDALTPEIDAETGMDLSLLMENQKLTPWERLLANDDTVNFCDAARAALTSDHATTE